MIMNMLTAAPQPLTCGVSESIEIVITSTARLQCQYLLAG